MNFALNNGLTLDEVEEIVIQLLPYVDFPAVATAVAAAGEVGRDRGLENEPHYQWHRGLL